MPSFQLGFRSWESNQHQLLHRIANVKTPLIYNNESKPELQPHLTFPSQLAEAVKFYSIFNCNFYEKLLSTFSVLKRIRRIKLETTTSTTTTTTTPGPSTSTTSTTTTTHMRNPNFDWERKFNKEDLLKFKLRMNQLHPKSNYGANQVVFNRPAMFFRYQFYQHLHSGVKIVFLCI